ncbi:DNA adenine methylase [Lactococcus lactis]|uniref:DNA adenine methylase n=1 Tax=Lactococcus lactis TaxID=1358 RepID=UPI00072A2185|nr:DNA adenine methylase [Lactococcus lactis]KSU17469.1 Methyl-directed repair DNA adenine methylase [Lactococcus lactis subsp. lactis]MCX7530974.1 DNA adenine methylase [Lactococcus lactis]MDM7474138.1 DNA adenine methylase [Lactococcus lactis]TRW75122.1 DNA adenine methylase [Lactococcus lactis]
MTKNIKNPLVKPFVKWVGGKKQLMEVINLYRPKTFGRYYEPFVGGGSVFMNLQYSKTTINDYNTELINVYEVVRDSVDELLSILKIHAENNSQEYFYSLREWDRTGVLEKKSSVERAARFIYLNKTCYNGLFRVNAQGQFNVPYGRYKNPNIVNEEVLRADSKFLKKSTIKILKGDFEKSVKSAKKGDFIYLDPPYAPLVEDTHSFVGYTLNGFGYDEQLRLRDLFVKLDKKGCYVMLSNSSSKIIHELYKDYVETTEIVGATRMVNSKASGRGKVDEVLIMNYDYKTL